MTEPYNSTRSAEILRDISKDLGVTLSNGKTLSDKQKTEGIVIRTIKEVVKSVVSGDSKKTN